MSHLAVIYCRSRGAFKPQIFTLDADGPIINLKLTLGKTMNPKKTKPSISSLSVGDVAKRSGVKVSTLHFYETKALISSVRNAGNQRRYKKEVLRRIAVIKAAQQVGIPLKEIEKAMAFLPKDKAPTKKDWQQLSSQWKKTLDKKIIELTVLRDKMTGCIGCGCLSLKACPMYNPNDELGQHQSGAVLLKKAAKQTD